MARLRASADDDELTVAWAEVESEDSLPAPEVVIRAGSSADHEERLRALLRARRAITAGAEPTAFLAWAEGLVEDASNNCRWQALILIGESIEAAPAAVWKVIKKYGRWPDSDMRAAVGTVLLEHLIAERPKDMLRKLRAELRDGEDLLRDTLAHCWQLSTDHATWDSIQDLVRQGERG